MRGLVIAGTHSGVGKTTVATGLMAALRQRGYRVQPFKAGPDYIDPSYHTAACGTASRNLDTWLLEPSVLRELFQRAMGGKDVAIVEGVMGLYDGSAGEHEGGSTAQLAKLLHLPVVLVVDAGAAARSVGATVLGFKQFDPEVNLVGVILNGIAGDRHLDFIRPSLTQVGVSLLGYLPRRTDLVLPERHLGLIPVLEGSVATEFYGLLTEQVERTIDVPHLLALADESRGVPPTASSLRVFPERSRSPHVAIAIATDKAFTFYYPDSLELLEAWGAQLIPFSPLEDRKLPRGIGGIYLGGGFPELYAKQLSNNTPMRDALQLAAAEAMPIYAECGGLMYLGHSLEDQEGMTHAMTGILPACSSLKNTRLTLGYRTVCALKNTPLMKSGGTVRGHEFHLSVLKEPPQTAHATYRVLDQTDRVEGFRVKMLGCNL